LLPGMLLRGNAQGSSRRRKGAVVLQQVQHLRSF
jgi:hypothetical protein